MCYSFRYCTRYALCHVACASRCVICCVSAAITNMSHNFFSSPTPTRTFRKSPHGATRSCVVYSTYPCQVRTLGKYRVGADLACLSRRRGFAGFKRRERERGMLRLRLQLLCSPTTTILARAKSRHSRILLQGLPAATGRKNEKD